MLAVKSERGVTAITGTLPLAFTSAGARGASTLLAMLDYGFQLEDHEGLQGSLTIFKNVFRISMGTGKTTVVFFSTPISVSVCK